MLALAPHTAALAARRLASLKADVPVDLFVPIFPLHPLEVATLDGQLATGLPR